MIVNLHIENFRSLRDASLELGRFTVLTGANNSGKSSVLYALQVLRNIVTNPNRTLDELLNLGFLNLGGIGETLFWKEKSNNDLQIGITIFIPGVNNIRSSFSWSHTSLWGGNSLNLTGYTPFEFNGSISISFPYSFNKKEKISVKDSNLIEFHWNGIDLSDIKKTESTQQSKARLLYLEVLEPGHAIRHLDIIPTQRGFHKPVFNQIPLNGTIQTEDEVATHLAIDKNLQAKVSHYFEKITGKRFSVLMGPGGGFFYLQVRESDSPFTTELVNQGMGVNQILFLLAKILYDKNRLVGIDEPEIHLHPSLIEKFISVLVEIAEKEDKQFIFSTHSEHWLMSLLAEVNDGHLKAGDLKVYYLYREGPETKVESQKVADNGQLEGGLRNFLEAEMRLTQRFLD